MTNTLRFIFISIIFFITFNKLNAQEVYERNTTEVNLFLTTMSQKGYIEWNDLMLPNTKEKIKFALNYLDANSKLLNPLEQNELKFYV